VTEVSYPAFLRLVGRRCVVIGGGRVGERKALALAAAGAVVTVIAPSVGEALRDAADRGTLCVELREYRSGDIGGALLAIAATDRPELNARVVADARTANVFVNSVDDPETGDFTVPATVRRGGVTVAISTGGKSPAFARHLREALEEWLTADRVALLELLSEVRRELIAVGQNPPPERWRQAVDVEVTRALERGDADGARRRLLETLGAGAPVRA
jgi:precorrin-2 dehydrogenase / sirohydrochlorin ferrochelatase